MLDQYILRVTELNPNVIVREASLNDSDAFIALFNKHYNRKTSFEYYQWQFFDSAILSKLFVAFEADVLIGMYGVKVHPLSTGELTGFVIDFLVDEEYRKRGIAFLLEGVAQQFGIENNIAVFTALPNKYGNAALRSMGWKSVAKVDSLLLKLEDYQVSLTNESISLDIHPLICFVKDAKYQQWRYSKHPVYKYEIIKAKNVAYAVVKQFKDGVSGDVFGDIVYIKCPIADFDSLFELILVKMREWNIKSVTTWALPHTTLYNSLMQKGFCSNAQERYFCVNTFQNNDKYLTINNWDLVQIDAEIF